MKLWNNSRIIGSFVSYLKEQTHQIKKTIFGWVIFCYTLNYPLNLFLNLEGFFMFLFRAVAHLLIQSKVYLYIAHQGMAGNQLKNPCQCNGTSHLEGRSTISIQQNFFSHNLRGKFFFSSRTPWEVFPKRGGVIKKKKGPPPPPPLNKGTTIHPPPPPILKGGGVFN